MALIRLTRDGHQLAGRVVLQAMLPKLSAMVRSSRASGTDAVTVEDRRHVAVATFWEVLSSYPVSRRRRGVAGNLALDTLHRLTAPQRQQVTEIPVHPVDRSSDRTEIPADPIPGAVDDVGSISNDASLRELVAWGLKVLQEPALRLRCRAQHPVRRPLIGGVPMAKRRRLEGVTPETRVQVAQRDGDRCVGCHKLGTPIHHRRRNSVSETASQRSTGRRT